MQLLIGILAILAPYRARCDISSADGTLSIKLITIQSGFWDPECGDLGNLCKHLNGHAVPRVSHNFYS